MNLTSLHCWNHINSWEGNFAIRLFFCEVWGTDIQEIFLPRLPLNVSDRII